MNLRSLVAASCIFLVTGLLSAEEQEEQDTQHSIRIQILLVESPGKLDEASRQQLSGPTDKVCAAPCCGPVRTRSGSSPNTSAIFTPPNNPSPRGAFAKPGMGETSARADETIRAGSLLDPR